MESEKQRLIRALKHYHDCLYTPGEYTHSICGKAALMLEQSVEVVLCKDCDWYRPHEDSICVNPKCGKSWYGCRVPEQHFCSYGERRTDG